MEKGPQGVVQDLTKTPWGAEKPSDPSGASYSILNQLSELGTRGAESPRKTRMGMSYHVFLKCIDHHKSLSKTRPFLEIVKNKVVPLLQAKNKHTNRHI